MKNVTMNVSKALLCVFVAIFLLSCSVNPPQSSNVNKVIQNTLLNGIYNNNNLAKKQYNSTPDFINSALTPDIATQVSQTDVENQGKHFNISVRNVPAQDFFIGLVKDSNYSVMVSPKVSGVITLNLRKVTVPEVLEAVRDTYGYEYQRTSYGYNIEPRQLETRMFTVNYINIDRKGESETTISSGQISRKIGAAGVAATTDTKPSSSVDTKSNSDFWKILQDTLGAIVGKDDGKQVVINSDAGLVIVRAYPNELRDVANYLDKVQDVMQRQVIIEAKVLEVELSAQYRSGIDWKVLGLQQTGDIEINDNLRAFDNAIFTLSGSANGGNFAAAIKLLNSQGRVNVLSSPRIAALNNQKAVIKVGNDQFFVTNVQGDTTSGTGGTETTQNIEFTPFFSGIALDVTPQINATGDVTLHIHPLVSDVTEQNKEFTVSDKKQNIPLAESSVRESDSVVRAKNGQVIVIGGLMESSRRGYEAGIPGADHFSGISELFKSRDNTARKFELVILLRPIVVGNNTWNQRLKEDVSRTRDLQQDYSYQPKIRIK